MPVLGGDSNQSRGKRFATLLAQIAPFLTVGTSVLMAIFADQTFGGVREAITVRGSYGPNLPWYMEYTRYTELFGNEVDGSLTRRFCVMITFFALFMVISAILRYRVIPGTNSASVMRLVVTFVGSLFFMTFTPTKWTHHFGAWAGIAGALAGVAAVAIVVAMRHSSRNRTFLWSGIMFLLAIALAGKNAWWYISSSGIPWFDKSISYHGIEASLVVLAISLLILIIGLGANLYRDMKRTSEIAENQEITADTEDPKENFRGWKQALQAPIAVVTALIVLLSLASFAKGAWSLRDGYTVAKGNIRALAGNTCNLAESVMVETDTNESFLQPIKGDLKDSLTTKNSYGFRPNAVPNDIRMEFKKEKTSTVSIESSPEMDQSTANASSTSGSSSSNSSSTSSSEQYENTPGAQQVEVAQSGLAAGYRAEPGINGSHAKLPYDIDPNKVPVMGSFSDGVQIPARTYTEWYDLGERSPERPLLVMSVAGPVGYYDVSGKWEFGQDIFVHYGKKNPDGSVTPVGNPDGNRMYNTGEAPRWRNLRLPMDEIPEDVDVIQIEAHDFNVTPDQWLVITPPRTPQMESMAEFLPDDAPTQLDWPVGLQFPCQRPFDHWGGVAELAQFRINSGDEGIELTTVMDYYGGGLLGMLEGTASETEIATYLQGDWAREWGNLEYYTLYKNSRGQEPKEAKLNTEVVQRSGLWNPTPMLRKKDE